MFYHWIWYNPSVQAHHAELKDVVLEGVALLLLLLHYCDFLAGSVHLMVGILHITFIYIDNIYMSGYTLKKWYQLMPKIHHSAAQ